MNKRAPLPLLSALILCASTMFASSQAHHRGAHATVRHNAAASHHASHSKAHHEAVRAMDPERATEIQNALIRKGYMTGEPTGTWDAASVAAMQKLQADNGWQTKIMPDSRALIKLGLGPQQDTTASLQQP